MRQLYPTILVAGLLLCVVNLVAKNVFPLLPSGWHVHDMERLQLDKVMAGKIDSDVPSDGIVLTENEKAPPYRVHPDKSPIQLQDNGYPVRFRNTGVREL